MNCEQLCVAIYGISIIIIIIIIFVASLDIGGLMLLGDGCLSCVCVSVNFV